MTDTELSRWIAEKLEPKPLWVKTRTGGNELIVSQGQAWVCPERCITADGLPDNCEQDHPRDMVSDPAMTVMLMKKLFTDTNYDFEINRDMVCGLLTEEGAKIHSAGFFIDWRGVMPLGRAVAEAFFIANGGTPTPTAKESEAQR